MIARLQSIWPAPYNSASSTSWSLAQTPDTDQSRRRRQQVMPEPQSISTGGIVNLRRAGKKSGKASGGRYAICMITIRDHQTGSLFDPWDYLGEKRRRLLGKRSK